MGPQLSPERGPPHVSSAGLPGAVCARIIHWLVCGRIDPPTIACLLRSCALVCRMWNGVARRFIERAEDSWIHLALQGRAVTLSDEEHLCAACFLTHILLHPFLLKYPHPGSFGSLTHLPLASSWFGQTLSIPSVGGLCGTIAGTETLQRLWLREVIWSAHVGHTPPVAPSRSRARIRTLDIAVGRRWLLDPGSVEFLTWLAHSGAVTDLTHMYLQHMMILEEKLLGALLAVLDASRRRLVMLACSFGPNLSPLPLIPALSQCALLRHLDIQIPCDPSPFFNLLGFISNKSLPVEQLDSFGISLLWQPICQMPTSAMWRCMDDIFQMPPYLAVDAIIASYTDLYIASRREIAEALPLTYQRRGLWHRDDPYSLASPIPARVDRPFPVEICERIMDFVAGEPVRLYDAWAPDAHRTLVSCSLTCRAWRPRAQAHLFTALTMAGDETALSKLRVLLTHNPALGPFVRIVTLHSARSPSVSSLHMLPIGVTRLLPNLRHLRIVDGTLHVPPCASFGPSIRRLSSLTTLAIVGAVLPSVEDARQVISACRHLQELSLEWCKWQTTIRDAPEQSVALAPALALRPRTSIRLQCLYLAFAILCANDQRTCQILRWLSMSGALDSCATIFLANTPIYNDALLAAVEAVVCAARKAVEVLVLLIGHGVELTRLGAALSACPKLRLISIILPYDAATLVQLADMLHAAFVDANVHRNVDIVLRLFCCPGLGTEPTPGQWQALDDIFQVAEEHMFRIASVHVTRYFLHADDGQKLDTVNWTHALRQDDAEFSTRLKTLLPQTFRRNVLYRDEKIRIE
ncbi:hypothetical protein PsYK624_161140 [Phanerochaete sordida]|uniref:F-box domain-containing protein n=1 Tax=Phanerochaete sordida TaxID=48140 RepID=A0A9P3GS66_9APHY|nr:hypothetical protein PsYK624_161140 [Phanerochaete sordida]